MGDIGREIREMKKGTKVKLIDGSYSTRIENGEIRGNGNIVTGCIYEVIATDLKLPTDYSPLEVNPSHWNDTILKNVKTGQVVFVESRFIREIQQQISIQEAARLFDEEGKTVICEFPDFNNKASIVKYPFKPESYGGMKSSDEITFYMINSGTWYVEDSHE